MSAEGAEYVLELRHPFDDVGNVSARHGGDQLVIQLNNQRRNDLLPKFLAYYTLQQTRVEKGWLRVRFGHGAA